MSKNHFISMAELAEAMSEAGVEFNQADLIPHPDWSEDEDFITDRQLAELMDRKYSQDRLQVRNTTKHSPRLSFNDRIIRMHKGE